MAQIFKAKTLVANSGRFAYEVSAPNLVYNTSDQNISGVKNFYSRPTVDGTGVLLIGEASSTVLPNTIVYTTGNQNINGLKNFSTIPTVNGTGVLLAGSPIPFTEASGAGGSVFITDITSNGIGNVGDKVYENISDGVGNTALISCSTTTQNVLVNVYALQGRTRFKPKIYITGSEIAMTRNSDAPVFKATNIAVNLLNSTSLRVDHEDGAYHTISIVQDAPPQVTSAYFYGSYPTSPAQTELKFNDTFNFTVNSDVPIVAIQIYDFGAARPTTHNFTAVTSKNIIINIADRGNTTQNLGVKLRVQKANGSWSSDYLTSDYGSTDGTHTVKLNNIGPSISFGTITYPGTQGALKGTESATVVNNVSDYNTILYTSSQLDITSSTLYQNPITVSRKSTSTGGTDYNPSSPNLTITAVRTANNKSASGSVLVKIANGTFNLNISTNGGQRLRTGGSNGTTAQSYTVTISSSHELSSAPTLAVPAGGGTLSAFGGSSTSWNATLSNINDDLTKTTYNWGAISAKNLAGTTVTIINSGGSYVIGGFVSRSLTLAAFQNTLTLNTSVSDFSKMTLSWPFDPSVTTRRAIGTQPPNADSWTIDNVNANPTTVIILDTSATQSSSQATSVTVQETA